MSGQLGGACPSAPQERADDQAGETLATRPCPSAYDRALVYLLSHGLLEMNDEVQAAMSSTETDHSDRNFWTAPRFETGDPRNQWLNQALFPGKGRTYPGFGVGYRVYLVYRVARRPVRRIGSRRTLRSVDP